MKYIEIGHTKKTYGVGGDVRVTIYDQFLAYYDLFPFVFIEMDGIPVPWQVEHIKEIAGLCFKFSNVNSPEEAQDLTGKPMLIAEEDLPSQIEITNIPTGLKYSHFVGYSVFLESNPSQPIGVITDVQEYPNQEMAIIKNPDGGTHLVPMVDAYFHKITIDKRELILDLPEGLIEIDGNK